MNQSIIRGMQWLDQQQQLNDVSVNNMMYDEYKDLEKRLIIEIPEHRATRDDIRKHRDMNKVLSNRPPFKVMKCEIVQAAMKGFCECKWLALQTMISQAGETKDSGI